MRNSATSTRAFEGFFLIALLVFGVYGILFFFNHSQDNGVDISAFTQNDYEAISTQDEMPEAKFPTWSKDNSSLAIEGLPEAGTILRFRIENFNENINYILDFGDGSKKKINGNLARFAYENPGNYEVKLIAFQNGTTKIVHSEQITISKNLAMVMN